MTDFTAALLEECTRLLQEITPGDWQDERSGIDDGAAHPAMVYSIVAGEVRRTIRYVATCQGAGANNDADAEFIAAAPRLLRALVAVLQQQQVQETEGDKDLDTRVDGSAHFEAERATASTNGR